MFSDSIGRRATRGRWLLFPWEHRAERDAQAKEREVLQQLADYAPRESSKATVEDLLNAWLRVIAPTEKAQPISPKTYEKYVSIVKGQLVPYLEKLPLQKLTPKHITEMQIKLREGGSAVLRVCMFTGFYIRRSTLELRRCECSKITPPPWCRLLRRHFEKSTLTRARSFC